MLILFRTGIRCVRTHKTSNKASNCDLNLFGLCLNLLTFCHRTTHLPTLESNKRLQRVVLCPIKEFAEHRTISANRSIEARQTLEERVAAVFVSHSFSIA